MKQPSAWDDIPTRRKLYLITPKKDAKNIWNLDKLRCNPKLAKRIFDNSRGIPLVPLYIGQCVSSKGIEVRFEEHFKKDEIFQYLYKDQFEIIELESHESITYEEMAIREKKVLENHPEILAEMRRLLYEEKKKTYIFGPYFDGEKRCQITFNYPDNPYQMDPSWMDKTDLTYLKKLEKNNQDENWLLN